jgi:transcriptional regulator with XRE-family HTH domain
MVYFFCYAGEDMEVNAVRLRQLREAKGLSLRDLEWLSGVSYNTIWFIEAGRRKRTHRSTVQRLAQALGVAPTELMKGYE